MAAVAVTSQNTRIHDMESLTVGQTIGSIGGGAGAGLENTIFFQNANSIGRKVTDTATPGSGFFSTMTATSDLSTGSGTYQTALLKYNVTTSPDLDTLANVGLALQIGSDASNYEEYAVAGNDSYPARAGWQVIAIDPNIAGYVDDSTNGTPVLTAIDYWGIIGLFLSGGARDFNVLIDAIDVGNGLTLVSGDGADPDGTFQDFIDHDEGTIANRFGYALTNAIGFEFLGTMVIGNATATVFTDSDEVIAFSDGRFAAGWSGLSIGLDSATTNIAWDGCTFLGKGNVTTTDTRPVINVSATSGVHSANICVFDAFAEINLNSKCTYETCKITNSGQVDAGSGASLNSCSILTSTVPANDSAILWNVNLDPNGNTDNMVFTKGANAHHAIEFGLTSPLTMTLTGHSYSGFNASNGQNDSTLHFKRTSGTITLNISGGDTPSYRTDGATVNIVNDVTVTFDGMRDNSEVRVYNASTGVELDGIEDATAGAVDDRNFAAVVTGGTNVNYVIHNNIYETIRVENFTWPTANQTIEVQQRFDRNYLNQASEVTVSFQDGVSPTAGYAGTEDNQIDEANPNTNAGTATSMGVDGGSGVRKRSCVKWDISSIPATATVVSAEMVFDVANITTEDYDAVEINSAWSEGAVTWNNINTAIQSTSFGLLDGDNALGLHTITLNASGIALLQDYVDGTKTNNGFAVSDVPDDNTNSVFLTTANHATTSIRPKLTITYNP